MGRDGAEGGERGVGKRQGGLDSDICPGPRVPSYAIATSKGREQRGRGGPTYNGKRGNGSTSKGDGREERGDVKGGEGRVE